MSLKKLLSLLLLQSQFLNTSNDHAPDWSPRLLAHRYSDNSRESREGAHRNRFVVPLITNHRDASRQRSQSRGRLGRHQMRESYHSPRDQSLGSENASAFNRDQSPAVFDRSRAVNRASRVGFSNNGVYQEYQSAHLKQSDSFGDASMGRESNLAGQATRAWISNIVRGVLPKSNQKYISQESLINMLQGSDHLPHRYSELLQSENELSRQKRESVNILVHNTRRKSPVLSSSDASLVAGFASKKSNLKHESGEESGFSPKARSKVHFKDQSKVEKPILTRPTVPQTSPYTDISGWFDGELVRIIYKKTPQLINRKVAEGSSVPQSSIKKRPSIVYLQDSSKNPEAFVSLKGKKLSREELLNYRRSSSFGRSSEEFDSAREENQRIRPRFLRSERSSEETDDEDGAKDVAKRIKKKFSLKKAITPKPVLTLQNLIKTFKGVEHNPLFSLAINRQMEVDKALYEAYLRNKRKLMTGKWKNKDYVNYINEDIRRQLRKSLRIAMRLRISIAKRWQKSLS